MAIFRHMSGFTHPRAIVKDAIEVGLSDGYLKFAGKDEVAATRDDREESRRGPGDRKLVF